MATDLNKFLKGGGGGLTPQEVLERYSSHAHNVTWEGGSRQITDDSSPPLPSNVDWSNRGESYFCGSIIVSNTNWNTAVNITGNAGLLTSVVCAASSGSAATFGIRLTLDGEVYEITKTMATYAYTSGLCWGLVNEGPTLPFTLNGITLASPYRARSEGFGLQFNDSCKVEVLTSARVDPNRDRATVYGIKIY